MMEYPLYDFKQLGFVDLVRADLIAQCAEGQLGKNCPWRHLVCCANIRISTVELVQKLFTTQDGTALELTSHCVVVPPDTSQSPSSSSNVFQDAFEQEMFIRRCMLDFLTSTKSDVI
jgi:hypothetical protein